MVRTKPENERDWLQEAFDYDPSGKAILSPEGICLSVNHSFCKIVGLNEFELLGSDLYALLSIGGRPTVHFSHDHWEINYSRLTSRPCRLSASISSVKDSEGRVLYSILYLQDITERKLHEKEIARLHNEKQLILDSVSEGIYGLDLEGRVTFWNKAAENMTGYRRYELAGADIPRLLHEDGIGSSPAASDPLREAIRTGNPMHVFHSRVRRKNGTSFPVEYTLNPIHENGRLVGSVITFKDITEKEHARELMIKSEKLSMAGQLAAGVAHEIRNPLTSLKGFVQLIQSGAGSKPQYYEIMLEELGRIEEILNELLMLAKPQAVHFRLKNVDELLQQVVTLLSTQANLRNVEILVLQAAGQCFIHCDGNQIKQVFINMIKNAIEAMPQGGKITLETYTDARSVHISISDEGSGIPQEKLRLLGEPFYTTKEKGTGLGLMVSYKIIEHHGGSVGIRSEVGCGTTFHITFPRAAST
jgi:PAS domain S-box-containing protein